MTSLGRIDKAIAKTEAISWQAGKPAARKPDYLAKEEPLEIRVRGRSVAVTMRTPGNDEELAAGFLLTEAIIRSRSDVTEIGPCQQGEGAHYENTINAFLAPAVEVNFDQLTRHVFASSSCGLCGKASIESVHQHFAPVESDFFISGEQLLLMPDRLRSAQEAFSCTGGLHAAAIFDGAGELIVSREDVGRHNAVDKVIGHGFLSNSLPFDRHVLLVSGRASFEIMQKALAARISVVAALSAPSSLAVAFAKESGQTLIGFLRERSLNLYSHPGRVLGADFSSDRTS
ncbi:MAG: formate dehydrogenase accessory sulfurtransferase FdhD [Pedosphaera sp.]|nr:formate dehydrogenase accessory sulfurtransferase FdhD [Pedosphaera sp.]